jgi:ferredoxin
MDYTQTIRDISSALLKDGKVDMVIGFGKGTLPMATCPRVARTPEQARTLIWDSGCALNLANYLTNRKEKIGIVAKGCDSRNIVTHIIENKISREQLHIIGVPCTGMVDRAAVAARAGQEVLFVAEEGATLTVTTASGTIAVPKAEVLKDNCRTCRHKNPVIYDDLAGPLVEESLPADPFADVTAIEAMSSDEKWSFFGTLLKDCIRCYACRNACPLCYCPTCFVDESNPQWVGKGQDPTDVRTFHFLRAFHCAGRCTDCGACEQACPMGIRVRHFTRKLVKDSYEIYGWEAGLDLSTRPTLDTFKPEDADDFIK